jgi:NAD(P)-dependent dehydrogenase (short-subunit alcohol dehydrogenase family)
MMATDRPVALVTGASSGIGKETALALVAPGFHVVGTSRDTSRVTPLDGVTFLDLDVAGDAAVTAAVQEVSERFGRIDVLVNNAGAGSMGAAEETSVEQAQAVFDTNVFGVMRMVNEVLPHMRAQRRGRIINISSVLGFLPQPYMAAYAASKHAIEGYTESLDHEIRDHGVRALIVEPAYTRTGFEANSAKPDTRPRRERRNAARLVPVPTSRVQPVRVGASPWARVMSASAVASAAASVMPRRLRRTPFGRTYGSLIQPPGASRGGDGPRRGHHLLGRQGAAYIGFGILVGGGGSAGGLRPRGSRWPIRTPTCERRVRSGSRRPRSRAVRLAPCGGRRSVPAPPAGRPLGVAYEEDRQLRRRLELRAASARGDLVGVRSRIRELLDIGPFAKYG